MRQYYFDLIGEIERAAKSPAEIAEIIAARAYDLAPEREASTAGCLGRSISTKKSP